MKSIKCMPKENIFDLQPDALRELERALQDHDWFYHMSDDHRAYKAGEAQREHIDELLKEAKAKGYGVNAQALYDRYRPLLTY